MNKNVPDSIPRTIITGNGIIRGDLSQDNEKLNLIFINAQIGVFGLNGDTSPYAMFATPDFLKKDLPDNVYKDLVKVKQLYLKPSFSIDNRNIATHCKIPDWLIDFKDVEVLKLDFVELGELEKLYNLPIRELTLVNIKYDEKEEIQNKLEKMNCLQEIFYDKSMENFIKSFNGKTRIKYTQL